MVKDLCMQQMSYVKVQQLIHIDTDLTCCGRKHAGRTQEPKEHCQQRDKFFAIANFREHVRI